MLLVWVFLKAAQEDNSENAWLTVGINQPNLIDLDFHSPILPASGVYACARTPRVKKENAIITRDHSELLWDLRGRWLLLPACRGISWQPGTALHAVSLAEGIPWAGLSLAASWIRNRLEVNSLPLFEARLVSRQAARWISISVWLRNCHDFISSTEIVRNPILASHSRICLAIIRLSYTASTTKPIPVQPTQPPPQILQAPRSG